MRSLFRCCCLAVLAAFMVTVRAEPLSPDRLLIEGIIRRLELSREVAWSKACTGLKVADPAREAQVLAGLKAEGRRLGLAEGEVDRFFIPQIAASRRLQEELVSGWRRGFPTPPQAPKDLATEIRPKLDALNRGLLLTWSRLPPKTCDVSYRAEAEELIRERGFSADIARIAARPLDRAPLPAGGTPGAF